ncbi:MAG: hypothetical protein QNJ53_26815 [Pleurocapsa sp. MO_192.B19]|nr:hypothetical protein [Pleurocapsa sp. MO_192.B19]
MVNQVTSPLDTEESIADLADMLTYVEDAEGLALLSSVPEFTRSRLNRACRLLSSSQQQLIRQWVMEIKQGRSNA